MAQTCTALHYHIVFSTKDRVARFSDSERQSRVWSYLGGIAGDNEYTPHCIGGYMDHVHLLISVPAKLALSDVVKKLKGGSSMWINTERICGPVHFAWQKGFGAFTVSRSQFKPVVEYIENQREHHQNRSFQEEYLGLLRKHQIDVEERYLWD